MTSKFTDRLKRLHQSRVRALDVDEPDQPRVFTADVVEPEPTPKKKPPTARKPAAKPAQTTRTLDATKREQLERQQRLSARSTRKPRKLVMSEASPSGERSPNPAAQAAAPIQHHTPTPTHAPSTHQSVGEKLTDLRIQASALIQAGRVESAVPLLHEMVSLSPTNPFPLAELVKYYRSCGLHDFASMYESRLKAVAPY